MVYEHEVSLHQFLRQAMRNHHLVKHLLTFQKISHQGAQQSNDKHQEYIPDSPNHISKILLQ